MVTWAQQTNLSAQQDEVPLCVTVKCRKNIYFIVDYINLWTVAEHPVLLETKLPEFLKIEMMIC